MATGEGFAVVIQSGSVVTLRDNVFALGTPGGMLLEEGSHVDENGTNVWHGPSESDGPEASAANYGPVTTGDIERLMQRSDAAARSGNAAANQPKPVTRDKYNRYTSQLSKAFN